jgi:hypothetical protein
MKESNQINPGEPMMIDQIFQWYSGDITDPRPKGYIFLSQFINAIRAPKKPEIFAKIAEAKAANDIKAVGILKASLPSFTPAVIVRDRRRLTDVKRFTGLFPLDFDKLELNEARELKKHIFNKYSVVVASWLSASGRGVRCFIRIPVCADIDEYRQYYISIAEEYNQYPGFDRAVKNAVLPLFFSYDPDILHRDNPEQWTTKSAPPPLCEPLPVKVSPNDESSINRLRTVALKGLTTSYDRIPIDGPGHPEVISIARRAGGFVGSGILTNWEAENLLIRMISSHPYLRQKKGTYCKTAIYFINEGIKKPITPNLFKL